MTKNMDYLLGGLFALATVLFMVLFLNYDPFFNWAFARHHHILSWYIRPLFILPIVYFAFKKSLTGIFASVFALFTSMFWFSPPEISSPQVIAFLDYEMTYLKGAWTAPKVLMSLTVPLFFTALIVAAWFKNWKLLLGVVVCAALLKILWSVVFGGEAGMSIIKPALMGLVFCVVGFYYYRKRLKPNE